MYDGARGRPVSCLRGLCGGAARRAALRALGAAPRSSAARPARLGHLLRYCSAAAAGRARCDERRLCGAGRGCASVCASSAGRRGAHTAAVKGVELGASALHDARNERRGSRVFESVARHRGARKNSTGLAKAFSHCTARAQQVTPRETPAASSSRAASHAASQG